MYKKTHINNQRRADALTPKNFAHGDLLLTPEQKRDSLVSKWKSLEANLKLQTNLVIRRQIGKEMQEIQNQINAIRPKLKGKPGVANHFIEVARERLTAFQYKMIMDEASKRANTIESKGDK